MKHDIQLNLNFKYGSIVPLYNLPSKVKESIVTNNMNTMFDTEIFASDDKYEDNNVPNYDLFNKHVFDIFQQVNTIEFAYTIVVSKWNVLGYHFPTIAEYLFWRKKWLSFFFFFDVSFRLLSFFYVLILISFSYEIFYDVFL